MQSHFGVWAVKRRRLMVAALVASFGLLAWHGVHAQSAMPQARGPASQAGPSMALQSPTQPHPGVSQSPDYRLGSGDRVRITVFGQKDLSGEYLVDGTGMLAFPLIGQVPAGQHTAGELAQELSQRLSPDYVRNPNISVEVLTYRPFYIVGEVKQPGSYPYVSGMSVINAIALAGGFTYRARESSFYVTRAAGNGQKARIDAGPETPVQPGDVITVRERYF